MRTRAIEGGDVRLVYSKAGDLLGLVSRTEEDWGSAVNYRFRIYVFSLGTQKFDTIGWVDTYDAALTELRRYE